MMALHVSNTDVSNTDVSNTDVSNTVGGINISPETPHLRCSDKITPVNVALSLFSVFPEFVVLPILSDIRLACLNEVFLLEEHLYSHLCICICICISNCDCIKLYKFVLSCSAAEPNVTALTVCQ